LGIGELGLMPDQFWNLTFAELFLLTRARRVKQERTWEWVRWLGAIMINLQVKRSKQVTPESLIPLSFDKARKKETQLTAADIEFMKKNWV